MRKHYTDLDGMRGILACLVMLFHYGLNGLLQKATYGLVNGGVWELCVDFFFTLSGFVMAHSFNSRPISILEYFYRRIKRIFPLYILSISIVILTKKFDISFFIFVTNILLLQSFLGSPSINFPSWSIPFEFYLPSLAITGLHLINRRPGWVSATALLMGSASLVLLAAGVNLPLLRAASGLSLGFGLYGIRDRWQLSAKPLLVLALFLLAITLMIASHHLPSVAALFPPLTAALIILGSKTDSIFSSAPFQALGRWSYGIYLLHIPVLLLGQAILSADRIAGLVPKLVLIATTIAAAALAHAFVEKPLMRPSPDRLNPPP